MRAARQRKTFRQIVAGVSGENVRRRARRAQIANRLAKTLTGRARGNAYTVRHRALLGLVRAFGERIYLSRNHRFLEMVVVNVENARLSLHLPAAHLGNIPAGKAARAA